jgi:hypothetical protein
MKLRYLLSSSRTVRQPGLVSIMRDWFSFLRFNYLYAALDCGLLHACATPASRDQLIERLGVQRTDLLDALLDMGLSLKELSLKAGLYRLRGRRSRVLATESGDPLAAIVQASATYYHSAYLHLAGRMRGAPLGDDLRDIGETVARFSKIGEHILGGYI